MEQIEKPNPVAGPVESAVLAWFPPDGLDCGRDTLARLGEMEEVPLLCAEAIACYVAALSCLDQKIILPEGGSGTSSKTPAASIDFSHPRFAYIVASWFDHLSSRLPNLNDEWDSRPSGGFRLVRRDGSTGNVITWVVRDLDSAGRSIWHVQSEGDDLFHATFAVPHNLAPSPGKCPGGSAPYEVLGRSYAAVRLRLNRLLGLLKHIVKLGAGSTEEYRQWCKMGGFSTEFGKSARDRSIEVAAAGRRQKTSRRDDWFAGVVDRLHQGTARQGELNTDYLRLLSRAFAGGLAGGAREQYRDLLLHCHRFASLGGTQPVIEQLGWRPGNTYVEALAELARHYRQWLRPLADWRPKTRDPRAQFASLIRHLLTRYEIPSFMDSAWFYGRSAAAQLRRDWFLQVVKGVNIRSADLPLKLTKRMAHCFFEAPPHYTIEMALRRAQIVGQGGGDALVQEVLQTPLGASFDHEDFWATVVTWWVVQPEFDPEMVTPVYDYIQYRKFEPREVAEPGGVVRIEQPPEPNFSMKSRSAPKLLEALEAWHAQLDREARAAAVDGWPKSSIPDFYYNEESPKSKNVRRWKIVELCTQKEMSTEGREMRHCVSSYSLRCRGGKLSVWSLRVAEKGQKDRRLMTIALDPQSRVITQLRGRLNLTAKDIRQGKGGVDEDYSSLVGRSRACLWRWMQEHNIGQRGLD